MGNYVNNFFKNPCLENSIVFKDKLPMNNNLGEEEPIQGLFTENENRNDLNTKDVDYIEIFTNKNNFVDKKQENNNNNIDANNNDVKEKIIEDKNINDIKKQKSNTNNTTKTTLNRKTKTKSKPFKEEEPQKKEIEKQKVNINDKLVITIGKELPFNIQFTPDTLGRFKASIVFQLEDGISFDIDILANVIGPELAINTPLIDFGLFASGTIQKREIEIENLSPIKAQYLIREARYNNINFDNFQTNGYIEEFEGVLDESKDIKYRDKVKSLIEYDNTNMKNLDIMKLDCYSMKFSSVYGELAPFEKKTIVVSFLSPYPVRIEKELNTIEIITKNSKRKGYINFSAQCEEAEAYILDTFIIPKEIFLTMPIQHKRNIFNNANSA